MSNLVINNLQVQLNQTQENVLAHQNLIILTRLGSQVRRTQVWSGDKFSAQWNEDIRLNRTNEDALEIRLSALETPQSPSGQLLGVARIPFSQIQQQKTLQEWFSLIIKDQEAGKVFAKIQYSGDSVVGGSPSHVYSQQTYAISQGQSPTFASSSNHVGGSEFSSYTQALLNQQQTQNQLAQVVQQRQAPPSNYQIAQQNPQTASFGQPQSIVAPQSQVYMSNMQSGTQLGQNNIQYQHVGQAQNSISQYPTRQIVQYPQQQQHQVQLQQGVQYAQQQQPVLQQQVHQQIPQQQGYQVIQNQPSQIQYVQQQQQVVQPQIQSVIGGQQYQLGLGPQPYEMVNCPWQKNKYRMNSVSHPQQHYPSTQPIPISTQDLIQLQRQDKKTQSQIRLQPYQVQHSDDIQGLTNAFDNQLYINSPPTVYYQQQPDFIQQQPLMQSVVNLIPATQYQEQQQQAFRITQPFIQDTQQPQTQLSNSQIRLLSYQQVQQQPQIVQQAPQLTQPFAQQAISTGQQLSNSQIRLVALQQPQVQAVQQSGGTNYQVQQQPQTIMYSQSPQYAQQGYIQQPQIQYVQQGQVIQQQQPSGVQYVQAPYGGVIYQQ